MRIAYVANYQGPDLVKARPCLHNLSLAARVKIELIADLLKRSGHDVEVFSQGALEPLRGADVFRFRYYPPFAEKDPFHPGIPVRYASALSVKFFIGAWESFQAQRLLRAGHDARRYDAVIIYNLQRAQIGCAGYAVRQLGVPVILQYEDDSSVDMQGRPTTGVRARRHQNACQRVLRSVAGGMAVSPYLLSQLPADRPRMLLRGVVSDEIVRWRERFGTAKKNWAVFSGTHEGTQGLEQLVRAWRTLGLSDWELHIAGSGPLTPFLKEIAGGDQTVVFHGLLNRDENARLICQARIGMNPQDLTSTPGHVFAFKIIEYLAAADHVITTPRGSLEPELEHGVTYIADNTPEAIATSLQHVIQTRGYEHTAEQAAVQRYGLAAVSHSLNALLRQVTSEHSEPSARA